MNEHHLRRLSTKGFLSEDVGAIFCGSEEKMVERQFLIQLDGDLYAKQYWSEPNLMSPQRYLREVLKDHPDAMILKTRYL